LENRKLPRVWFTHRVLCCITAYHNLLWRDRIDVPSKRTIVRVIGRTTYRPKNTKESVVGIEVTLSNAQNQYSPQIVLFE
jgi:hypothetical protein